jgi:hypothetical protein
VIVDLTNNEREDQTLGQLRRSSILDVAAQMKAQDMADNEYFAHFSPTGVSPWFWFAETQYNFVNAGENLAIHFTDSGEVVDAWMESPAHRANIMNGNYTEIGVGTAEGEFEGFKTLYIAQFFGTPAVQPAVTGAHIEVGHTEEKIDTPVVVTVPGETDVLAEAVTVVEDVVYVEANPVPVTIRTENPELEEEKTNTPDTERIASEMAENDSILFSDFMSTSTGAIPASINPTDTQKINNAPYFLEVLTRPSVVLQILYIAMGLLVLVSLVLSIFVEIRKQHPIQIVYSMALFALMGGLFYLQWILGSGAVIV